ncbi:unnamed protein product, partial [Prorocentrum cordatum]
MTLRALSAALLLLEAASLSDVTPLAPLLPGVSSGFRLHGARRRALEEARKAAVEAAAARDGAHHPPASAPRRPRGRRASPRSAQRTRPTSSPESMRCGTTASGATRPCPSCCNNVIYDGASSTSLIRFIDASVTECKRMGDRDATIYVTSSRDMIAARASTAMESPSEAIVTL